MRSLKTCLLPSLSFFRQNLLKTSSQHSRRYSTSLVICVMSSGAFGSTSIPFDSSPSLIAHIKVVALPHMGSSIFGSLGLDDKFLEMLIRSFVNNSFVFPLNFEPNTNFSIKNTQAHVQEE